MNEPTQPKPERPMTIPTPERVLLPCPFCGHEHVRLVLVSLPTTPSEGLFVECEDCGARGPTCLNADIATRRWNVRSPTCKRCGGQMLLLDGEWECHNVAPAIAPTPSAQAKCEQPPFHRYPHETLESMAEIGEAFMDAMPKGYSWMQSPAEVIADLTNERDEARAALSPPSAQAREALEAGAAALEHVATGHNLHTTTGFEHARILRSLSVGGVAIPLGTITPAMVHKMCHYLNGEKADSNACAKCPAVEKTTYGDGERGCYGIAFETLQMARCFMYEGATGAVASQWRDIATAPTEVGSCVIVLCEGWKFGSEACLHDEGWYIAGNDPTDSWGPGRLDPTKWQPLPAAPGADSAPVSA